MAYEVKKDPDADLDYGFDWSAWLGATDTITASTWAAPAASGLTMHGASISPDGNVTSVWLSAGNVGGVYSVTNHIKTAAGREDERSMRVTVVER